MVSLIGGRRIERIHFNPTCIDEEVDVKYFSLSVFLRFSIAILYHCGAIHIFYLLYLNSHDPYNATFEPSFHRHLASKTENDR